MFVEMHYTPDGTRRSDQTSVGIRFAKTRPQHRLFGARIGSLRFEIPPNASNYEVSGTYTLKADASISVFDPHMHLRGKDARYDAIFPDGTVKTLFFLPHYDANWQDYYEPKEPIRLPKGTKLQVVLHFDNSADNPNNPDPASVVRFGEQTWDEMAWGFVRFTYDDISPASTSGGYAERGPRGAVARHGVRISGAGAGLHQAARSRRSRSDTDPAVKRDLSMGARSFGSTYVSDCRLRSRPAFRFLRFRRPAST